MKERLARYISALALPLVISCAPDSSPSQPLVRHYTHLWPTINDGANTYRLAAEYAPGQNYYFIYLINALDPQGQPLAAWQVLDTDHNGPEASIQLTLDHQTRTGTLDPHPDIVIRVLAPNPNPTPATRPI